MVRPNVFVSEAEVSDERSSQAFGFHCIHYHYVLLLEVEPSASFRYRMKQALALGCLLQLHTKVTDGNDGTYSQRASHGHVWDIGITST